MTVCIHCNLILIMLFSLQMLSCLTTRITDVQVQQNLKYIIFRSSQGLLRPVHQQGQEQTSKLVSKVGLQILTPLQMECTPGLTHPTSQGQAWSRKSSNLINLSLVQFIFFKSKQKEKKKEKEKKRQRLLYMQCLLSSSMIYWCNLKHYLSLILTFFNFTTREFEYVRCNN